MNNAVDRPVLFFDFDDTLSEFVPFMLQYVRAVGDMMGRRYGGEAEEWAKSAADMFETLEADYQARFVGNPRNGYREWFAPLRAQATQLLFAGMNLPLPDNAEAVANETLFAALAQCDSYFPGAIQSVQTLAAQGYTLHMASGNDSQHLRAALAAVGLDACFTRFYGPDLTGAAKEGPEFYAAIWADLNLSPECALIIDNDPVAISWAMETGANAIQVKLLPDRDVPTASGVRAVLTDLMTLPEVITKWKAG